MTEFYTIAIIAILGAISPGPDFVVVSKNAIAHSRQAACYTSLGIALGILVHSSYCILGLAIVISQSLLLFSFIKYIGAIYLVYLGTKALITKNPKQLQQHTKTSSISNWHAFREGFLVNVLNPKCILFMLAIFTMLVKPHTPSSVQIIYGLELSGITGAWFILLSFVLTHQVVKNKINKIQKIVTRVMGAFLIAFGIHIAITH